MMSLYPSKIALVMIIMDEPLDNDGCIESSLWMMNNTSQGVDQGNVVGTNDSLYQ